MCDVCKSNKSKSGIKRQYVLIKWLNTDTSHFYQEGKKIISSHFRVVGDKSVFLCHNCIKLERLKYKKRFFFYSILIIFLLISIIAGDYYFEFNKHIPFFYLILFISSAAILGFIFVINFYKKKHVEFDLFKQAAQNVMKQHYPHCFEKISWEKHVLGSDLDIYPKKNWESKLIDSDHF